MTVNIVVVGSVNTDLIVRAPRLPLGGETLTGSDFHTISGGKGANQAVAAARQGGAVSLVACIGDDDFGAQQRKSLGGEGIDLSRLSVVAGPKTGVAVITVDEESQNSIVVSPEANGCLDTGHVEQAGDMIAAADLLICQLETPLDTVCQAIALAHARGTAVILNPAPVVPLPDELLRLVDYLIPNETEASLLAGLDVVDLETARHAVEILLARGVKNVLLTLGEQGVMYSDAGTIRHEPARRVQAVDTTAAGDTFIGSFAVALGEGRSLRDAVRFAQNAAALAVTIFGAQTSIPRRAEVEQTYTDT